MDAARAALRTALSQATNHKPTCKAVCELLDPSVSVRVFSLRSKFVTSLQLLLKSRYKCFWGVHLYLQPVVTTVSGAESPPSCFSNVQLAVMTQTSAVKLCKCRFFHRGAALETVCCFPALLVAVSSPCAGLCCFRDLGGDSVSSLSSQRLARSVRASRGGQNQPADRGRHGAEREDGRGPAGNASPEFKRR